MPARATVELAPLRAARAGRRRTTCAARAEASWPSELRERLRDSVRAHLVADVPVGRAAVGRRRLLRRSPRWPRARAAYRISTFSIGFEERSFNELELARLVAERYGTDHHELMVRPDAVELLPKLVEAFDEPFADSSALPTYLVSRARLRARQGRAVGRGGRRAVRRLLHLRRRHARAAGRPARVAGAAARRAPAELDRQGQPRLQGQALRPRRAPAAARAPSWLEGDLLPEARARAAARPARAATSIPLDVYRARYAETEGADELARLQDVDSGIYLADDLLVKTDRTSMAHSLEARVPFCDPVVAELALALPAAHEGPRVREEAPAAARRSRRSCRPRSSARASRASRSRPRPGCVASSSRSRARCSSPDAVRRQGYFNPEAVTALLDGHAAAREDLSRQLWGLLAFALWHDRYGVKAENAAPART